MARWQTGLADVGWNSLYWNNHDQPRVVSRFGDDGAVPGASAKALATVLHLHRGTPYVYQGEELGMANYPFAGDRGVPRRRVAQPLPRAPSRSGEAPDACWPACAPVSRDNARTPMQWDAVGARRLLPAGGTALDRRQPRPRAASTRPRSGEDPGSVFAHYRRLIELRHTVPVVALGDFTMLLPEDEQVYAFTRSRSGRRAARARQLSSSDADVEVPDGWAGAEVAAGSR